MKSCSILEYSKYYKVYIPRCEYFESYKRKRKTCNDNCLNENKLQNCSGYEKLLSVYRDIKFFEKYPSNKELTSLLEEVLSE